jgi:rhodanese-related sulfurtransferase
MQRLKSWWQTSTNTGERRLKNLEHLEQCALIRWCALNEGRFPELRWIYAIPNGGQRNIAVAAKLKKEGVKAGVPDLCLPVARGGYHALYIELKAGKNKPTASQLEWQGGLNGLGNMVVTCWGWEPASHVIERYMCK